jgi:hypothetical protein
MKPARKKKNPEDEARRERKEQIKDFMKNGLPENYIPSIHQYCDRWCEKCDYTSRCSSYSLGQQIHGDNEPDISQDEFWEDLSAMFEATYEMLIEHMKMMGMSDEEIEEVPEEKEERKRKKHPLAAATYKFSLSLHKWMMEHGEVLERVAQMKKQEKGTISPAEALEIIQWYNHFIAAKIDRAIYGWQNLMKTGDENETYDMNGSAKIALIAIDRSIGAWGALLPVLPQLEDEIFRFIKTLIGYRKRAESLFPAARAFVRPGFDE